MDHLKCRFFDRRSQYFTLLNNCRHFVLFGFIFVFLRVNNIVVSQTTTITTAILMSRPTASILGWGKGGNGGNLLGLGLGLGSGSGIGDSSLYS